MKKLFVFTIVVLMLCTTFAPMVYANDNTEHVHQYHNGVCNSDYSHTLQQQSGGSIDTHSH